MRVLIDATSLLLRSAGIKSYTYHWLQALRRLSGRDQIEAFPFLESTGALDHERSVLSPLATYSRLATLYAGNLLPFPVFDWAARNADVFHVSNQIRRAPSRVPLTATIHDLTCWLMPELHTAANVRADQAFADQVWKRAARLIAVSENSKRDAVRLLGIPEERIEVIYSGVAEAYFDAAASPHRRPYLLYVGTIEPRKNIDTLLDAWTSLPAGDYDLIVAGASGWSSEQTVRRLRSGLPGLQYRGYVPEAELPSLVAGAAAFVYPSLYEGFGFPVAQAMAARVPVITSGSSCLPEVAGDGALYVDPRSAAALAAAMQCLMESESLRESLATAGRARAERYRWEACARRSLAFFRAATD